MCKDTQMYIFRCKNARLNMVLDKDEIEIIDK